MRRVRKVSHRVLEKIKDFGIIIDNVKSIVWIITIIVGSLTAYTSRTVHLNECEHPYKKRNNYKVKIDSLTKVNNDLLHYIQISKTQKP